MSDQNETPDVSPSTVDEVFAALAKAKPPAEGEEGEGEGESKDKDKDKEPEKEEAEPGEEDNLDKAAVDVSSWLVDFSDRHAGLTEDVAGLSERLGHLAKAMEGIAMVLKEREPAPEQGMGEALTEALAKAMGGINSRLDTLDTAIKELAKAKLPPEDRTPAETPPVVIGGSERHGAKPAAAIKYDRRTLAKAMSRGIINGIELSIYKQTEGASFGPRDAEIKAAVASL